MLVRIRDLLILVALLQIGCVADRNPREAASRPASNVGSGRSEFEDAVSRGFAFVIVGACDPRSDVRFVEFESGSDYVVGILGNRLVSLFAVDPRLFRLRAVVTDAGTRAISNSHELRLEPGTVSYVGGILEPSENGEEEAYALGECSNLYEALPSLFPYQIARLPFRVIQPR